LFLINQKLSKLFIISDINLLIIEVPDGKLCMIFVHGNSVILNGEPSKNRLRALEGLRDAAEREVAHCLNHLVPFRDPVTIALTGVGDPFTTAPGTTATSHLYGVYQKEVIKGTTKIGLDLPNLKKQSVPMPSASSVEEEYDSDSSFGMMGQQEVSGESELDHEHSARPATQSSNLDGMERLVKKWRAEKNEYSARPAINLSNLDNMERLVKKWPAEKNE
jgi:hypothetical protein